MSDFIIRQDGEPTNLSATRIATRVAEGSANWIPEQITNLARITINSNGEYLASNDGYYGYAIVNVCVAGGNDAEISGDPYVDPVTDPQTGEEYTPDHETEDFTGDFLDPELETPTKVTPPPNSKTGTQSGKVMGIDPDTGEYVQVSIDQDGNIVTEAAELPKKIRVLTPPAKTDYVAGEKINYAGLKVSLLTEDDEVFQNDDFPWGYVTCQSAPDLIFEGNNLITPMEYAIGDGGIAPQGTVEDGSLSITPLEYPFNFVVTSAATLRYRSAYYGQHINEYSFDKPVRATAITDTRQSNTNGYGWGVVAAYESFTVSAHLYNGTWSDHTYTSQSATVGGRRIYFYLIGTGTGGEGGGGHWDIPFQDVAASVGTLRDEQERNIAALMLGAEAPETNNPKVQWKSPYDGNTYETEFQITVTE